MPPSYNHWLVGLSIVVAMLVSYTALRLASRVATAEDKASRIWLGIGAIAMGVGIWSMHFVGMLAFSLPIPLAYDVPTTLASLAVAIITSGFALGITSGRQLTVSRLAGSAVIMGTGISGMHYMGMAAITVQNFGQSPMTRCWWRPRFSSPSRPRTWPCGCFSSCARATRDYSSSSALLQRWSWDSRSVACTTQAWRRLDFRRAPFAGVESRLKTIGLPRRLGIFALGLLVSDTWSRRFTMCTCSPERAYSCAAAGAG